MLKKEKKETERGGNCCIRFQWILPSVWNLVEYPNVERVAVKDDKEEGEEEKKWQWNLK